MSGAKSYHAGRAAEDIVQRHYEAAGLACLETRWRGKSGEIDLIFKGTTGLVFVEVKTSATIDRALASLSADQLGRILLAAEEYGDTYSNRPLPMRIDLAAVDAAGRVDVIKNISI